jgi:hypothetical protein
MSKIFHYLTQRTEKMCLFFFRIPGTIKVDVSTYFCIDEVLRQSNCAETFGANYYVTWRRSSEERIPQPHRRKNL